MDCFNSLLLKLREVHEREVDGWQMKIQELSNKKGCDTKRMEELFTKNQQMKEQQRLLTDNIKTLENRLRAGLCDRCTVTQEVAKRRQQEFEASQIQSLQHVSLLAAEMNILKKENKKLREEIRSLRAALEGHSDLSSSSSEVKPSSPPNLSPSSRPISLISGVSSRSSTRPAEGGISVKTETEHRTEDSERELRQWRGPNRNHLESYRPLTAASWKPEQRRSQTAEGPDHRPLLPLPLKSSSSSDLNPSRCVPQPSVPCRPQPIKSSPVPLPWPLSESTDWVSAPGSGLVLPLSPKSQPLRFPSLVQTSQQGRKPGLGSLWHKQSAVKPAPREPTVLFRLKSLSESLKPQERRETQTQKGSADGPRETCEGPLDLSERGKSKPNQTSTDHSPLTPREEERVHSSPDLDPNLSAQRPEPSPVPPPSSSPSSPGNPQEEEGPDTDHSHTEGSGQREPLNRQSEQNNKRVPVLTLSLRPVVVLETLNSALQKRDFSLDSKSSSPAAETGSSSDGLDEEEGSVSGQESVQSYKRKRMETDGDSETENIQAERKIQVTVRTEEKSPR
ncbi:uncharacterized protein rbbp8l [Halichoeres trimaculatus]|uniref:uncharacterized protein rbbp8l n=1 Tax=Halichoeres trimaculatus TaxID=147232 RepID=UPI003D9EB37F